MISWIVLVVSLILIVFGVATGIGTYSWLKDAQANDGTVIGLVEKKKSSKKKGSSKTYAPRVSYLIDGEQREFVSSQSSSPPDFKVGESVRVATNLAKDKECIATFGELYGFSVVLGALGMAVAAATTIFINGDKLLAFFHPHLS